MATNLWRDVDALMRLSRSARDLESDADAGTTDGGGDVDLLPASDRGAFQIATCEMPARVVSGDLADAFELPGGEVALVLADVSGKGVPAGVLRAFTRSIVRHVAHCSATPGETLARVNGILFDARLDAMFVSLFLGWLDPGTGRLRYANAGHPSPLRFAAGVPPEPFAAATGPILGILGLRSFATEQTRLKRGESMLLYTDGVAEARNAAGRFLGARPLAALLAQHASEPLDDLCGEVARMVDGFQGRRRHDDATVLALRWLGV
jgi:sigma-B regulation protein RsbU (phosphoserine phosphatase)